jgi:hypothetical protein
MWPWRKAKTVSSNRERQKVADWNWKVFRQLENGFGQKLCGSDFGLSCGLMVPGSNEDSNICVTTVNCNMRFWFCNLFGFFESHTYNLVTLCLLYPTFKDSIRILISSAVPCRGKRLPWPLPLCGACACPKGKRVQWLTVWPFCSFVAGKQSWRDCETHQTQNCSRNGLVIFIVVGLWTQYHDARTDGSQT